MILLNSERKPARLEEVAEYNPQLEYLLSRRRLKGLEEGSARVYPTLTTAHKSVEYSSNSIADQVIWGIIGGIAVLAMIALIRLW